jgi:starvation-inducible outer membrane lipoprotein
MSFLAIASLAYTMSGCAPPPAELQSRALAKVASNKPVQSEKENLSRRNTLG